MEKIYQYIEKNKDMYIHWLQELCRQESVSTQNRGMEETVNLVEHFIRKTGAEAERLETSGYPVLYSEINEGKKKTLSFYNHYDVQPEDPIELWDSDPYGAEIKEGKIIARGVADNKGNLMARICAVHAFKQTYGHLPTNVKFIIEGEEEVGSIHLEEFIQKYPDKIKADGCIWESGYKNTDGGIEVRLGVKGMLYVELKAQGASSDQHSKNASIIPNPAWRLVWALSTLKNEKEEILIDGFYDRVIKPNSTEWKILKDMSFEEEDMLKQLKLDGFLRGSTGFSLKEKLIFQPTCNISGIESGYTEEGAKSIVPSEAKVKIDFRLVNDQDPEDILKLLRQHLNRHGFEDIKINSLISQHGAKTDPDSDLAKTVINIAEEFYGQKPQIFITTPATGPMYNLCQKFDIPCASFGVGNSNSNIHSPNENIKVDDYVEGIKFVATVLKEFSFIK